MYSKLYQLYQYVSECGHNHWGKDIDGDPLPILVMKCSVDQVRIDSPV